METTGAEFRLRSDVSVAETDYGMVLLDSRSGEYWQLNDTGAEIVRLLLDGRATEDVVRFLVEEYEVDSADAARDVDALVASMLDSGMVVR
ncbi:lasso peptide biosynthesis PqqD family chaperone [Thermobifida halotolerans]|uniref:Lasso peptide biosynthesis PqqD family chaperone n=1 Tax=Thermobifida halotolerans TaxID=483545 RepID=A0A399G8D0_9ACTN|nr:lasso peptide biosynthesis PqqD family chaperone [Thermobifida halotolerans]UOE20260.1 lasso peptide biosynthesis PqqD family chaperone [Thermobifida halotolerans]